MCRLFDWWDHIGFLNIMDGWSNVVNQIYHSIHEENIIYVLKINQSKVKAKCIFESL